MFLIHLFLHPSAHQTKLCGALNARMRARHDAKSGGKMEPAMTPALEKVTVGWKMDIKTQAQQEVIYLLYRL